MNDNKPAFRGQVNRNLSPRVPGSLYVVATPIGNLQDMTGRAIEILMHVDLIACEDTRHTAKLLHHYRIDRPLTSYHEFNEREKSEEIAAKLDLGLQVALVSDAGTPSISDPGYRLIRLCRTRGIPVVPVPGASALVAALSVSGQSSNAFFFQGFLPARRHARRTRLEALRRVSCTLVFYESPHRIEAMLSDLESVLGDRQVFVAREITKVHEEHLFGRIQDVRPRVRPIGEFVVVTSGNKRTQATAPDLTGLSRNEVLKLLASRLGISRSELYSLLYRK